MNEKGQVWVATLEAIAAHVQRVMADRTWTPRLARRPSYDGSIPELGFATPQLARP